MTDIGRNIHDIADQILAIIPESETILRRDITYTVDAVCDNVPESVAKGWVGIMTALVNHFPAPDEQEDWHQQVLKIWEDKS